MHRLTISSASIFPFTQTDASISTHIENVQKRNYVSLESGRRLLPSKLGLVLAQGYHLIDSSLVLPKVRSDIEDQCNKIAKGEASKDAVVRKAIELFSGKFDVFVKNIEKMDVLFGSSFSALSEVGKPFTRCGLTRRYLQVRPFNRWCGSDLSTPRCTLLCLTYTLGYECARSTLLGPPYVYTTGGPSPCTRYRAVG